MFISEGSGIPLCLLPFNQVWHIDMKIFIKSKIPAHEGNFDIMKNYTSYPLIWNPPASNDDCCCTLSGLQCFLHSSCPSLGQSWWFNPSNQLNEIKHNNWKQILTTDTGIWGPFVEKGAKNKNPPKVKNTPYSEESGVWVSQNSWLLDMRALKTLLFQGLQNSRTCGKVGIPALGQLWPPKSVRVCWTQGATTVSK